MRRMGRVILAAVMCAALLSMLAGVHVQAGHCCAGECCPICPVIEQALSVVSGMTLIAARACAPHFRALTIRAEGSGGEGRIARTLVTMKCELLN